MALDTLHTLSLKILPEYLTRYSKVFNQKMVCLKRIKDLLGLCEHYSPKTCQSEIIWHWKFPEWEQKLCSNWIKLWNDPWTKRSNYLTRGKQEPLSHWQSFIRVICNRVCSVVLENLSYDSHTVGQIVGRMKLQPLFCFQQGKCRWYFVPSLCYLS